MTDPEAKDVPSVNTGSKRGIVAKIAAILAALAGFIAVLNNFTDVVSTFATNIKRLTCDSTAKFPWCQPQHAFGYPPNDGLRTWIHLGKYTKNGGWTICRPGIDKWTDDCKTLSFSDDFDPTSFDHKTDPNGGIYRYIGPKL
jgi:hypothetical protein